MKDPLHQGWRDGSLRFCISCTCGSSDRHAVLHFAGAPETWIRHQCWAAGTANKDSLFFSDFHCFSVGFGRHGNCFVQISFEFDLKRCEFLDVG